MSKKIHRFITDYKKSGGSLEINDANVIHQFLDVLKLRTGEACSISNGDGFEYKCEIEEITKSRIVCRILSTEINNNEPVKKVTLYQSILKKENFELVLQKASEMGIHNVVPVISDRTVKTNLNFERLAKISREASELSGRTNVTGIAEIVEFEEAMITDKNIDKILFDITGELKAGSQQLDAKSLSIYIGPEGGFTEKEIAFAKEHGAKIYNLGQLTLRGETASIVASYLALQ